MSHEPTIAVSGTLAEAWGSNPFEIPVPAASAGGASFRPTPQWNRFLTAGVLLFGTITPITAPDLRAFENVSIVLPDSLLEEDTTFGLEYGEVENAPIRELETVSPAAIGILNSIFSSKIPDAAFGSLDLGE